MSGPPTNRGFNAFHGFDSGPPPPAFGPQQPQGQWGGFWGGWAKPQPVYQPPIVQAWPSPPQWPAQPPSGPSPAHPVPQWPGQPPASPAPPGGPNLQLKNPWGGTGCPPGVEYMFPEKHCPFNVLKTKEKPWQIEQPILGPNGTAPFVKVLVPLSTTVKELMQNLGCTNETPAKNILYEITEAGNGRWKKGITIGGADTYVNEKGQEKDKIEKPITHFQWNEKRTGKSEEGPVVWIYLEKD